MAAGPEFYTPLINDDAKTSRSEVTPRGKDALFFGDLLRSLLSVSQQLLNAVSRAGIVFSIIMLAVVVLAWVGTGELGQYLEQTNYNKPAAFVYYNTCWLALCLFVPLIAYARYRW